MKTQSPYISTRKPLSRRAFLKGSGALLGLPLLDAMLPTLGRAAQPGIKAPKRMFAVCNNLGLLKADFFPKGAGGRGYELSPYLQYLAAYRDDFTVFSGVSHPNVDGGHPADVCFLTCAPHPGSGSFRNTISLDQFIAERIGILTRFPSLTLSVNTRSRSLSCTGTGVAIPPEDRAAEVFKQLFVQGTEAEIEEQLRRLETGWSILDSVAEQAKEIASTLGHADKERVDQYFTSVRDLEQRLKASAGWERKPKPVIDAAAPVDPTSPAQYMAKVAVMYGLAKLALETDSTRAITLMLDSVSTPVVEDIEATITEGYHNLSHHGKSSDKLSQLGALDIGHMKKLSDLFGSLKNTPDGGGTLLDNTMIVYGSNFGDANAHTCFNMPVIFAGGGFKHGQHLALGGDKDYPLPNLFVSMLHRMGIEEDKFASSTSTMRGLEMT